MKTRIRRFWILGFIWIFIETLAVAQVSSNVTFLGNFDNYSNVGYNDCWGYTAPDGREYALLGVRNGTSIIDITNTDTLVEISFIPSATSIWKDIKTYQNYAYVVTESSGGMQIIDLSNLPDSASLVTAFTEFSRSHNIYIDEPNAMLYVEGNFSEPVWAYSLVDPVNPVKMSSFGVECHDVYAQNNIVYVSEGNHSSIGIFDLSDPAAPTLLQRINIPAGGYAHNTWLSEDGNYLMSTEETPGKTIKLWDVSDLNNITMTDEILGPSGLAHNAHIKGNFAYVSHYADGLRIIDISDPANIFETGFYDTFLPPSNSFAGNWGAFPFFRSGKVLISDEVTGLYVIFFEGAVEDPTGVPEPIKPLTRFELRQNYPNPFNPSTTIEFQLPETRFVKLNIYNALGQKVRTLVKDNLQPGFHQVQWNGRNDAGATVASGIYIYSISAGNFRQNRKLILLR